MREVFGDPEGALDLLQRAYQRIDPQQAEERAWHLTRIAEMYLEAGKSDAAENTLNEALSIFPDYHLVLGQLALVRLVQGRAADAVAIESQRLRSVPRAENLYALASALAAAGRSTEARLVFFKFELAAKNRTGAADNANCELRAGAPIRQLCAPAGCGVSHSRVVTHPQQPLRQKKPRPESRF